MKRLTFWVAIFFVISIGVNAQLQKILEKRIEGILGGDDKSGSGGLLSGLLGTLLGGLGGDQSNNSSPGTQVQGPGGVNFVLPPGFPNIATGNSGTGNNQPFPFPPPQNGNNQPPPQTQTGNNQPFPFLQPPTGNNVTPQVQAQVAVGANDGGLINSMLSPSKGGGLLGSILGSGNGGGGLLGSLTGGGKGGGGPLGSVLGLVTGLLSTVLNLVTGLLGGLLDSK